MNDIPRQKLSEIITKYGDTACDPRRCEGLLRDYCGQYPKEIFLLVNALHKGVTNELIKSKNSVSPPIVLARLTKKLQDELGITEESAFWAVDSWGLGLGVISEPRLPTNKDAPQEPKIDEDTVVKPTSKFVNVWAVIAAFTTCSLAIACSNLNDYQNKFESANEDLISLNREYQNYKNSFNNTESNIKSNIQNNVFLTKESHVSLCNASSSDSINVALMYHEKAKESNFKSKGWWPVKKDSCESVAVNIDKNETAIYIHGESGKVTWGSKDFSFCVTHPNLFDISNANQSSTCPDSTVNATKFIIVPGMNTYTFKDY